MCLVTDLVGVSCVPVCFNKRVLLPELINQESDREVRDV